MDTTDMLKLVEAFRGYRDLLTPIEASLSDFAATYDALRQDIAKLNTAFEGDVTGNLHRISDNLTRQANKTGDLAAQIDRFVAVTTRYTDEVEKLLGILSRAEDKLSAISRVESEAEAQLAKLDVILEEKKKTYNVKELQRTLDSYNDNVQKVSEYLNRGVQDTLQESSRKLDSVKSANEALQRRVEEETAGIARMCESFSATNELLRTIVGKQDVNEAYLFDMLDKWAESRHVKTKK